MRTLVLLVFASRERDPGGDYAYVTIITEPRLMRKALLGVLSLVASHKDKNMDEYEWKEKIVSREQRRWFASIGKTWVSKSRTCHGIAAQSTGGTSDYDYMESF
jgi:hypothetical protein